MKLQGISINIVRNEYEYEKHVSEEYRRQYDWEASKGSMPWIILDFSKTNEYYTDAQNKVIVNFSVPADFTNLGTDYAGKGMAVVTGDKTKFNFDLGRFSRLMLEAKKDCGLDTVPANMGVTVTDEAGNKAEAALDGIDLSDKDAVLKNIDEKGIQQGGGYMARLLYEIIAQGLSGAGTSGAVANQAEAPEVSNAEASDAVISEAEMSDLSE